jgi:hypothetical protein
MPEEVSCTMMHNANHACMLIAWVIVPEGRVDETGEDA